MKKRVQSKLINEIKKQNWSVVADMVIRQDIYLSSKGTDFEEKGRTEQYIEPIYSFMAYSLTDKNLVANNDLFKSIFKTFLKNYHEKTVYMKAPLYEKKESFYTPLYYLESIYKKYIKHFSERHDLFKYYSQSLIAISQKINDKESPADYLSAQNKNFLTVPLYIEYYKKRNELPSLKFLHKIFSHDIYEKNDALPEYNINTHTVEVAYPELFSTANSCDKIISYFSSQYTSGNIALWIQDHTKKLTVSAKNIKEGDEPFLLSLIPAILNSFADKTISLTDIQLANIFKEHNERKFDELYYIYPYSHARRKVKVSLDDFIFQNLLYGYKKNETMIHKIIHSFIKNSLTANMFDEKLNPLEFLFDIQYQGEKVETALSILCDYPQLFERNKKNGKNFWHYLRVVDNVELLNPFLKHGDIDNIDNEGNHAFSEITYFALQKQNKETINWLAELLKTKKIKNISGHYCTIPMTDMIKNSPVLLNAANTHYFDAQPEIHNLCYFLKITDIVSLFKKYDNIDVNQINSKNETPLLLLLNSERNTEHAYLKKQKIYDLICKYINHDMKIKYNDLNLTAIDIYVKNFKREGVNLKKEKFIGHIIKNTTNFNNDLIARYIADIYYSISENSRYSPRYECQKLISQFNEYIGFDKFSIELKSCIVNAVLNCNKTNHLKENMGIKLYYLYFNDVLGLFKETFADFTTQELVQYKEKISSNYNFIKSKINNINNEFYANTLEAQAFFERVILDKEMKKEPINIQKNSRNRL